jgi:hypothetical protein
MLDVLEVQDKLKNFSQEQLLREMQMPSGSVPQFLVLSELNRRRTMSQDMEKQKMADQPTVKEEVVAASGMPMPETSMLAQQMAPQTSMAENTGIAAMMPKELPSEEEPMKMSYGGVLNSRAMVMAQPLRSSPPLARPFPFGMQQQRDNLGFKNLGSNIVNRIGEKSQGEVDEFIGEVRDMADERFDLDLTQEPQFDTGGKGFPPPNIAQRRVTLADMRSDPSPSMMYRKEGGPIKAQSGMFADIRGAITGADAPSFSMPPAFASIYNYAKTVLGLDDELARDVANKTIEQGNIDKSQLGMFSAKPFGSVEERLSGDDRLAQRKALDTFTGGAEMNRLVDQLSKPQAQDGKTEVQDVEGVADLDLTQVNPLFSAKPFGTVDQRMSGVNNALAQRKALDNFSGGAEMSNLISQLNTPETNQIEPSITDLESQYGSTFPIKNIKKSRRSGVKGQTIREIFGLPDATVDRNIRGGKFRSPTKEVFPEPESFPQTGTLGVTASEAEEQAKKAEEYQTALKTFSGGEEVDKLVDTLQKEQKKKQEEQEAAKTDSAGALGGFGATSGALSELEAEIDKLRAKREKGRESDKWFALAEVGLGMLASQSPTLAGALGEGGLKGLKSFREGKKEYDKDMLGYLTTKASIQKTRGELGLKSQLYKKQIEALKNKGKTGGVTAKELLASRDRQLARRGDLLKDLNIAADYTEFLESGGKTPASSTVLELLRLDENIKNLEKQLGSGFATVDLNTVN